MHRSRPNAKADEDRARLRGAVIAHAPLVAVLRELYPYGSLPALNATDREIGAYMGEQRLIERLECLLEEGRSGNGSELPKVL